MFCVDLNNLVVRRRVLSLGFGILRLCGFIDLGVGRQPNFFRGIMETRIRPDQVIFSRYSRIQTEKENQTEELLNM